jgi:hypothetical protein
MYAFMHKLPNRPLFNHFTSNLALVYVFFTFSVFGMGFDNVLYNTIQAMDGKSLLQLSPPK